MPRDFKVTVEVDDLYELTYTKQIQVDDQREGPYWTTKTATKTFLNQDDALAFIQKEQVEPTEFVRVTKLPLPSKSLPRRIVTLE